MVFAFALVMMIYFVNEPIVICSAALFSPNKGDLKYAYLAPFVILVYRPVYAYIRFYAYVTWLFKKDIRW
jgi:hypothetical protein